MPLPAIDLRGKRVLITGATSDIGAAVALASVRAGAEVILHGRDQGRLTAVQEAIGSLVRATVVADLASDDAPARLAKELEPHFPLAGFVHAAGLHSITPLRRISRAKLVELMAVNFFAAVDLARILSTPQRHDPDGTSIVFITSIAAHRAQTGLTGYAASKGALGNAAANLARELAAKAIRVNAIAPGWVETQTAATLQQHMSEAERANHVSHYPLGLGTPDDIAHACLFLLSPWSRWITGTGLIVDGGYSA